VEAHRRRREQALALRGVRVPEVTSVDREQLPIADRAYAGPVYEDAKDPDAKFPPIEPLRPQRSTPFPYGLTDADEQRRDAACASRATSGVHGTERERRAVSGAFACNPIPESERIERSIDERRRSCSSVWCGSRM
jgi:hypothetical protein